MQGQKLVTAFKGTCCGLLVVAHLPESQWREPDDPQQDFIWPLTTPWWYGVWWQTSTTIERQSEQKVGWPDANFSWK